MKGSLFALLAGAFITLQGVANTRISRDIGTWQTAAMTQFTGFTAALLVLIFVRDAHWKMFRQIRPLYLCGGALGAVIIFCNVTAFQQIGATRSISFLLIAQLCLTFLIDSNGWFGVIKQKMGMPQFLGLTMMIAGVAILGI